jgi:hypothetical protein
MYRSRDKTTTSNTFVLNIGKHFDLDIHHTISMIESSVIMNMVCCYRCLF